MSARAATELAGALRAFHDATGCHAALWERSSGAAAPFPRAASRAAPPPSPPDHFTASRVPVPAETMDGTVLAAALPGALERWLVIGPCSEPEARLDAYARFLLPLVAQQLGATLEVEQAARELAERYEEINLLYAMTEILGRAVTLEETATTILTELSETVGARRASLLVHDRVTDTLVGVAVLGGDADDLPPIAVDDPRSVSARVFRTLHPTIAEGDEGVSEAEVSYRRGAMLSVPILWTTGDGSEPLGVVNLSDRRNGQSFTAGDLKLVAAIATQIGSAIQNARLVRASLAQERLAQEMMLAHDLQMKLLPSIDVVAAQAQVAARVVPAESVGGDFYHLFRVGPDRTGVMIGDVSSHGYRAALIMALTMSASAIHAQAASDPGEVLGALLRSLRDELVSTEMFISVFYGVVDRAAGELRYANAGHPHAFVVDGAGGSHRLGAGAPPLGLVDDPPPTVARPWDVQHDVLLLFTDGVSDARDRVDRRLGEQPVLDEVIEARAPTPEEILERLLAMLGTHTGDAPLRDDLTLVVLRS